jgi:hypothetical protein
MKKHILTLTLCILALPALASANTEGYAWSESVGWFDFTKVVVSDTTLTGYAYNDNTGWLSFTADPNFTNTNGALSGFAWSESVGWFDFTGVTISEGDFQGYAYNDNTGWLNFTDGTVKTNWTPPTGTPPPTPRRSGSSGGTIPQAPTTLPTPALPTTLPNTVEGLTALLNQLQAQLAQLLSNTPALSNNPFTRDLQMNSEGEDVRQLQILLNSKGYLINTPPLPGAPGYESTYFGNRTQDALIKYQQDNNITPAVGYFGPITRGMITR